MRPIDADALKNHLEDLRSYTKLGEECLYYDGETNALSVAIQSIDNAPTVDAVPVVRCKDCKYFIQTVFFGNKMNACRRHGSSTILPTARIVADDWFCADGERKEE